MFEKRISSLFLLFFVVFATFAAQINPLALRQLVDRIGGKGAAQRFHLVVDAQLAPAGKDIFVLSSRAGKPAIKGSTTLAVATGLNWYLNHYAHINLTWNRPTTDLSLVQLPLPQKEERREATVAYRYYLNYCTFSYSMAFWTRERWLQEVDWMALHGINMPLMLVGMEAVWEGVLRDLGYSTTEVEQFIAGPGFQAWWLMNNLEGWGGPVDARWIARQKDLSRTVLQRMRELGMEPVLPGYSGMVPNGIDRKLGWAVADPGLWCHFRRPAFLSPADSHFPKMAKLYYKHLRKVMGTSRYYSMDPFHEGGNTVGVNLTAAFQTIERAMTRERKDAIWVIQSWNENPRSEGLKAIAKGKMLVLDLFSDGEPKWQGGYEHHDFAYCMLHNFGGRIGLHGRIDGTINGFYEARRQCPQQLKGVGATPEGIETNPVLYDLLFELPWRNEKPTAKGWLDDYVVARYGVANDAARKAWDELQTSVYDCRTNQQGTGEPIVCARPALKVSSVSTWSTSRLHYQPEQVVEAARLLLSAKSVLKGENYAYDVVDVVRQALTDRAIPLLDSIAAHHATNNREAYAHEKQQYLDLILDLDALLSTQSAFCLGHYCEMAQQVAQRELDGSVKTQQWLERNLRTQITVWGNRAAADKGGLHDYSNREWAGLLRDFHYPRWVKFFETLEHNAPTPDWFAIESAWTTDFTKSYIAVPQGDALSVAQRLFDKWFGE